MSSTENTQSDTVNEAEKSGEKNNEANESSNATPKTMKKVKSKKDLKNDPSRFDPPGVNFNAKLIGIDEVESARGDKMCQESMHRLKIAVKQSGQHKPKIIVNVSIDGIRIIDLRTHAVNHTHPVHRISFISRDITDHRAFGYVYGAGEGKHKFFAIKTEKAAEALVLTLRDLFQVVYELKKKEVEEAKHKIEEPAAEEATEAKEGQETESVYQVPTNGKPVENESDPTYQVPGNNKPVVDQSPDLLQMESELQIIERRIEQIDTMEELFKELEAPPTTTQPSASTSSGAWSSDLAGLSHTQTQPAFSIGGAPFSSSQPFPPTSSNPFPTGAQSFGGQQGFGGQQPFGMPGFPQQQPGVQPFQPPNVPPRAGPGFPGQPVSPQFPGTPFPGATPQQQPGFNKPGQVPAVNVTPVSDPFGSDPFGSSAFEENVLMPAKLQGTAEETTTTKAKPKDVFGDLVSIGDGSGTKQTLSPKDLFVERATPAKKSLNQMKGDKPPSPKPTSPVGFQASETAENQTNEAFNPFGTSDPFASDPFTSTGPAQNVSNANPNAFGSNLFGDDDEFDLPLPRGPPPPLPQHIASQPPTGPVPPPRHLDSNGFPLDMPPIPPRPLSTSSDSKTSSSSLNSLNESQTVSQQITPPPPPPRPECKIIPRPRPRPSKSSSSSSSVSLQSNTQEKSEQSAVTNSSVIDQVCDENVNKVTGVSDKYSDGKISTSGISNKTSISKQSHGVESHSDKDVKHSVTKGRSSSVVADPFVSTDPFASDDPFSQSDPFASDPFSPDPFVESSAPQLVGKDDPFTTVVTQKHERAADPFSVFDKTFSSDHFKFEKSSSRKSKAKVSA